MTRMMCAAILLLSLTAHAGPPGGAHPRFLVGNVKSALMTNSGVPKSQMARLVSQCDSQASKTIASGYQGFDWAGQMSACALAWLATGDATRAMQAVKYWKALLDDGTAVGDKMGGATGYMGGPIVSQDDGYSMRTYGLYSALGLDWLHDAPGVDATLRAHAIAQIKIFTDWYAASGYLNNVAGSNYFTGYFLALWASAIAVGTDDATLGPALWTKADTLTQSLVVPAATGQYQGGDWLEGWEYGELAVQSILVASAAAADNGYTAFANGLAGDVVTFHLYGLRPDGQFFDAGDHQDHPVEPGNGSIWGALLVDGAAPWSDYARQYLSIVTGDSAMQWAQAVAEAKSPAWTMKDWTTDGLPLSYHAAGTGTMIARSGWASTDSWASLQVSARLGADHQHADAGHFELQRGADSLAITSADYGTWATWNNNTLLFDDQKRNSVYPPNQGAWGDPKKVIMRHSSEVTLAACAQADFADSYASNHTTNSVLLARRDWVFVRPDTLVVNDRTQVDQASVKSTFALHTTTSPMVSGAKLNADVGASHLTSLTLLPASGNMRNTVNEPVANSGSGPWMNNDTWAPDFRAEETVTGATTNSFLHVLTAGDKGTTATDATLTVAGGARVVTLAGGRIVVLPDAADGSDLALPFTYTVPTSDHADHVVFGLAGNMFALAVSESGGNCSITLSAGSDMNVLSADATAAFHLDGCAAGPAPNAPANPDLGSSPSTTGGTSGGNPMPDAGTKTSAAKGGCSCDIGGARDSSGLLLAGLFFLLMIRTLRGRRAG